MSNKDDGGTAFPRQDWNGSWFGPDSFPGMTLRDWFAGQSLAGIGTWSPGDAPDDLPYGGDQWHAWVCEQRAKYAYRQADALIAERSKP